MPRSSLDRAVDRRLSEAARASDRFADLQVDFVDEDSGRHIARLGGRWDKVLKQYVDDAPRSRVFRMHAGQLEFADWFCNHWLDAHLGGWPAGEPPTYTALVAGGRRGGKTSMLTWLDVGYAVAVPGAVIWYVVPSDVEGYGEELRAYMTEAMPSEWYSELGAPHWRYDLINGSSIRMLSGFTPKKVKKGGANLVFINEAQQVPKTTYDNVRASIADHGGLVLAAANPPDIGDQGTWVADVAAETQNGMRPNARVFFVDPLKNPHIDHEALESLRDSMSEHEFDVQVRGMFLLPNDTVLQSWDRTKNERPRPDVGDCTAKFTKHHEGREYDHIVSIDVQHYPWIVAVVAHAYINPESPNDMDDALLWFDDEVYVDSGDEVDCREALLARGYDPKRTLIICDASGDWQQAERKEKFQRPEFKGKGSWDMLRGEGEHGYRFIEPPDRDSSKNPDIIERIRGANARIGTKSRKRFVFADPKRCPRSVASIAAWRMVHGKPSRHSKHAHAGDAITYLVWRFFPRRRGSDGRFEFKVLKRFDGHRRTKGF